MKSWRKCRITDDTAENRHCVQTDLDHGKEHAGIFLHIQNALGIYIAFISQQFKFDFAPDPRKGKLINLCEIHIESRFEESEPAFSVASIA